MKASFFKFFLTVFILLILCTEIQAQVYTGIEVGNKTSDSTGQITVSASTIQQSVIPTIPSLAGMTLTTSAPGLMVTPVTAYLILKGTDAGGRGVTVAVQLICNNSSITYHAHSSTVVQICKSNAGCNNCKFITMGNMIVTCECSNQNPGDSTNSACQNTTIWLR